MTCIANRKKLSLAEELREEQGSPVLHWSTTGWVGGRVGTSNLTQVLRNIFIGTYRRLYARGKSGGHTGVLNGGEKREGLVDNLKTGQSDR